MKLQLTMILSLLWLSALLLHSTSSEKLTTTKKSITRANKTTITNARRASLALALASTTTTTTTAPTTVLSSSSTSPSAPLQPTLKVSSEKVYYPKKVTSLKKRPIKSTSPSNQTHTTKRSKKTPAISEVFKNLPADDLEFIKELDKQFKVHGNKIKIKIERENSTTGTKNIKRTIDGELGYGFQHNGYEYDRPKYMFYPYSQKDIPPSAPGYYPEYEKTTVEIEPSYSYELRPQIYEEHNHVPLTQLDMSQQHHHQQQEQYEEPVIVLRIPGPTKYAQHLQALLQQYLEIRAAQYLRILEESELRKQQEQHYNPQQHLSLPVDYMHVPPSAIQSHHLHYTQPEVSYGVSHHETPSSAPLAYPEIDEVYQRYKAQHAQKQPQQQHHEHPEQQTHYSAGESHEQQEPRVYEAQEPQGQQQFYYMPVEHAYQPVYFLSMSPEHEQQQQEAPHTVYGEPSHTTQPQQQEQQPIYVQDVETDAAYTPHPHPSAPTNENNPRKTHTKVFYTHNSEKAASDYTNMYPLPSIRPYERHAPTSTPLYHQEYQEQQVAGVAVTAESTQVDFHHEPSSVTPASSSSTAESKGADVVAITQRPFNYHAHALKPRTRGNRKRGTVRTAKEADEHFDKIKNYVRDKLGAQPGTAVEFKTTQLLDAE